MTRRVLLDAAEVITDFDVQRPEVHEACGQKLDAREGLAFLLGDVMLGARIPDEYARKLGDRLGKLVFGPAASLPKERTALGRAHDKRVGRLSPLNPDYELKLLALTGERDRDRGDFDGKQVKLELPSLEECEAAAPSPPAAPAPPPAPDPLKAWCQRTHTPHDHFMRMVPRRRYMRAQAERAWKPRTYRERKQLAQTLEIQRLNNRACTCDDYVPSWLCQVHVCYALEAGTCDGTRPSGMGGREPPTRRVQCDCMQHAFGAQEVEDRWPSHKRPLLVVAEEDLHGEIPMPFRWLSDPPGGWYGPGFCLEKAARKLTTQEVAEWEGRRRAIDPTPIENLESYGRL